MVDPGNRRLYLILLTLYVWSSDICFQLEAFTPKVHIRQSSATPLLSTVDDEVDVAIVGAGLGGLCAGAILNTLYGKRVGIYEAHYLAGGCLHAYERRHKNVTFTFDSGPTILLGCSGGPPYNALEQVLRAVNQTVEWISYDGWGMVENPTRENEKRWRLEVGGDAFEEGPLTHFGGPEGVREFRELQEVTRDLLAGAKIPAMAMRPGPTALIPLLRYFGTLVDILKQGEATTGTFAPYFDGPKFKVTNPWLRAWLDALAFSLSGLPAARTSAAAMAFVLNDMHSPGAALDYPKGGMGSIVEALVRGVEQGSLGSKVNLKSQVASINFDETADYAVGLTLKNGKCVRAKEGVICNAPVWSLRQLVKDKRALAKLNGGISIDPGDVPQPPPSSWITTEEGSLIASDPMGKSGGSLLANCDQSEMTASFLHLHVALDATGLDMNNLEAHYTVMDRSLEGDEARIVQGVQDGPCGELNMIAVSNPCRIDETLAPPGFIVMHAYGAGNEPYEVWEDIKRGTEEYELLKEERADALWRALEAVIPGVRNRAVMAEIGSPMTHERFLRRPRGTYGSATESYLKDGSTPIRNFLLAGDGIFPGIGLPAVAISGAGAANGLVAVTDHWKCLDSLNT